MESLFWLDENQPFAEFPPVDAALSEPEGLLAAGGNLSTKQLIKAYENGIFPWYEEGQPILWWSPDPRTIIYIDQLHISRSLKKALRNKPHEVTFNTAFEAVLQGCAAPRPGSSGTWLTPEMQQAYLKLHKLGKAHSVEIWNPEKELIGGLYGILLNKVFSGESMFSRIPDASKMAMVYLTEWLKQKDIPVIDCQLSNPHLQSLGAVDIPRKEFIQKYLS